MKEQRCVGQARREARRAAQSSLVSLRRFKDHIRCFDFLRCNHRCQRRNANALRALARFSALIVIVFGVLGSRSLLVVVY